MDGKVVSGESCSGLSCCVWACCFYGDMVSLLCLWDHWIVVTLAGHTAVLVLVVTPLVAGVTVPGAVLLLPGAHDGRGGTFWASVVTRKWAAMLGKLGEGGG